MTFHGPRAKRHGMCPSCGDTTGILRDDKHDAYYCPRCNMWLEKGCDDPACAFCSTRPRWPSESPNDYGRVLEILDNVDRDESPRKAAPELVALLAEVRQEERQRVLRAVCPRVTEDDVATLESMFADASRIGRKLDELRQKYGLGGPTGVGEAAPLLYVPHPEEPPAFLTGLQEVGPREAVEPVVFEDDRVDVQTDGMTVTGRVGKPTCSFCGCQREKVVGGPNGVYTCGDCAGLANDILNPDPPLDPATRAEHDKWREEQRLAFRRMLGDPGENPPPGWATSPDWVPPLDPTTRAVVEAVAHINGVQEVQLRREYMVVVEFNGPVISTAAAVRPLENSGVRIHVTYPRSPDASPTVWRREPGT